MDILSKEIPVVGQGDNRQAAHGNVFTDKEVGREALAIPLIGANGTNRLLAYGLSGRARRKNPALEEGRLLAGTSTRLSELVITMLVRPGSAQEPPTRVAQD